MRGTTCAARSSLIKFVARHSASASNDNARETRGFRRPSCFSMHSDYFIGASPSKASRGLRVPVLQPLPSYHPSPLPRPPSFFSVALIIPCMQSAELCAWEYKKNAASRSKYRQTLYIPPRIQALVSNVILSHKAWWCIMRTHIRKSRMQLDARANGHHKQ